jgi:hypothetical protein
MCGKSTFVHFFDYPVSQGVGLNVGLLPETLPGVPVPKTLLMTSIEWILNLNI